MGEAVIVVWVLTCDAHTDEGQGQVITQVPTVLHKATTSQHNMYHTQAVRIKLWYIQQGATQGTLTGGMDVFKW